MSETLFKINEKKERKPVTCLGKVFRDDEERREYFRDELRKKLPELKKIDGFPIGEDEDIIALSDPPYYTACPNPWLDDFIQEWEAEKANYQERVEDFIVSEPFASDVSEGKNNPIYNAHSYHTKVPHPAIMRYILHYTQPGDIVFDGFAGTGMTGVAAQMCGNPDLETKVKIEKEWEEQGRGKPVWGPRKAINGDLSPIASFIAYNYNTPVDVDEFKAEAERILKEVEDELGWMYHTLLEGQEHKQDVINRVISELPNCKSPKEAKTLLDDSGLIFGKMNYTVWSDVFVCPDCLGEFVLLKEVFDFSDNTFNDEFQCPFCSSNRSKTNSDRAQETYYDLDTNGLNKKTKTIPVLINYSYNGKRYERQICEFETVLLRAVANCRLQSWYPIDKLPLGFNTIQPMRSHGILRVSEFYTVRNLHLIARLFEKAHKPLFKMLMTAALINTDRRYSFRENRKGGIIKGTLYVPSFSQENEVIKSINYKLSSFLKAINLISHENQVIYVGSATTLEINTQTIDYIFVDPPFGANIMYSELNFLWESWLKIKTNNQKEAIENKTQNKGTIEYQRLMLECFKEYYRILKPGKWMTVEFSNTSAAVWNGIQTAIQQAGFVIANVSTLDKQQGSFKAVTTSIAVKQDLVISCYKPSAELLHKIELGSEELSVWEFVESHLKFLPVQISNNNKTTAVIERSPKILYDRLLSFFIVQGHRIPIDSTDFQIGLKAKFIERDGQYFTAEQAAEYVQKKAMTQEFEPLPIIVTNEREGIEWLRAELQTPQKHQDVQPKWLQAVHAVRKGDIIPELQDILQQNFIELPDGKWRVPDMNEAKDREMIRNKSLIKEFNSYVVEIGAKKGRRLKEVRLEALIAGFKGCWEKKDFNTIVLVAEKIPQNLLFEDSDLLMFYDIAKDRV